MATSVIFSPTRAFEDAFDEPNSISAIIVVLLAGFFLGWAAYLVSTVFVAGVYFFLINLVQFLVLCAMVWFFELVHVRKRKMMTGTAFSKIVSVVGKLWLINLVGGLILFLMAYLVNHIQFYLFEVVGLIGCVIAIVLVVAWIVASFRLLKVVLGISGGKLLINWLILNILSAFITSFIGALLLGLLFRL
jgi:hypothetical protein